MQKPPLTVTIITLNEERNIARAIESVRWADEVIVVDSGSQDRTIEIARQAGAKVLVNPWPGYGKQKNHAQNQARNNWVLNIDADEEVSTELQQEITAVLETVQRETSRVRGFYLPRKTFYLGRWIQHGGWYPNFLIRLADRRQAAWSEPAVHEELRVEGETARLKSDLHHYTFASIRDQVLTNLNFSKLGSQELQRKGKGASLLLLLLKPIGKFIETYFLKQGFRDGLPGFIIAINAAHSMFLKYAYLHEAELNHAHSDHR